MPLVDNCRERGHQRLSVLRRHLRMDIERILTQSPADIAAGDSLPRRISVFFTPGMVCILLYRVAHMLYARGLPRTARGLAKLDFFLFKATITPASCIGGGLFLPHPVGVFFHGTAGERLTLYSLCACGPDTPAGGIGAAPHLGDDVTVAVHAAVVGAVVVGDRATVGFRVAVDFDVPADGIILAASQPATGKGRNWPPTEGTPIDLGSRGAVGGAAGPSSLSETRRRLRRDRARLREIQALGGVDSSTTGRYPAYTAVCLYRLGHYFRRRGAGGLSHALWQLNLSLTGADIDPAAELEEGLVIAFPAGVSIAGAVGRNLTVAALGSIAAADNAPPDAAAPTLGADVSIGYLAGVYGSVRVAAGVMIAPCCIVTRSIDVAGWVRTAPPQRLRRPVGY